MNINSFDNVYFIGIGGIGMSALARYFIATGKNVAGYDRTPTKLTDCLRSENIDIHFVDDISKINMIYKNNQNTLIVYTPAVPANHSELDFFRTNGFTIYKRSQVLGLIANSKIGVAVAGTHGKTTTSTLIAHLLKQSKIDCNAFLGGIAKNYESNLLLSQLSNYVVVEADEFDRSFLQLYPEIAVVTSVDADHLDIYGDKNNIDIAFRQFINQIKENGILLINKKADLQFESNKQINIYSYSLNEATDFRVEHIHVENGLYVFDFVAPDYRIDKLKLGIPGLVNVENAVAAIAIARLCGVETDEIRTAIQTFAGIKRRFEHHVKTDQVVYIDDYAHHPAELRASILSVRDLYPNRKITGIFQPHLYSRTRDFAAGFAQSLDLLDQVALLDIYPARELPIDGVDSKMILDLMTIENKEIIAKNEIADFINQNEIQVLITLGAGDIDKSVDLIIETLLNIEKNS